MPWNEPGSGNQDPWGSGNRRRPNNGGDLEDVIENVRRRFGGDGGGDRGSGSSKSAVVLFALVLVVFWAFQSFYTVQEGHESIELRFGKYRETVGAGLQFIFWPIEQNIIINSKNIRTVEIGFRKDTGRQRGSVRQEAQMLTTDENIADVSLAVQYNIRNTEDLLFSVSQVEAPFVLDSVVRGSTESALREVVGNTTMDDLFNKGREIVEIRTKELLQKILDRYETGVNVVAVEMQAAVPPVEVREAFENVNKADQLEEQLIKESRAYEEKVVLEAQGYAARILAEAKGYKDAVIARATGESDRFTQVLREYNKAPAITRKRLYIETMEEVLSNTNKIVIDQEGGNNMMYLPLDQIIKQGRNSNNTSMTQALSTGVAPDASAPSTNKRGGR